MISGLKNLGYLARGTRTYGEKPVLTRARGQWEFEFIFSGRARPAGGVECALPGETGPRLYVFHPQSNHGWTDEAGGVSEVFVIHFQTVPEELADRIGPTKPLLIVLDESEHRRLALRLKEVWETAIAGGVLASLKLQQLLIEMALLAAGRLAPREPKPDPMDKVSRALHWFEENLGEHPTVEDVAREVGVSAAHLRRLFAAAGRPPPREELARLRMAAARHCLRAGWKQEAVAQFLGFSETSAFARAFRDVCGRPPARWLSQTRAAEADAKGTVNEPSNPSAHGTHRTH